MVESPTVVAAGSRKQLLIEEIRKRNRSASYEFLAAFTEDELAAYLSSLRMIDPEPGSMLADVLSPPARNASALD